MASAAAVLVISVVASRVSYSEQVSAKPAPWSFSPPKSPALPPESFGNNTIDRFIFAKLSSNHLSPSPAEQPAVLLRRLYLDLVGLPPTPAQVDAFLADRSAGAYEKAVDELLASPRFGEKWARHWLDLARYADSNGYQRDGFRTVWPYRDWVIKAMNADMPYDQFALEQLAGDLIPNASLEQKIATGFNRGTTINVEAGTVPEADRVGQVVDRVNVMGTAFLGLTIGCAQCHEHKYDPFTQRDYYRLFAYFNQTPIESKYSGADMASQEFIDAPNVLVSGSPSDVERRDKLQAALRGLQNATATKLDPKTQEKQSDLRKEIDAIQVVTTLVMQDMPTPRETYVLRRGLYDSPTDRVEPGLPAVFATSAVECDCVHNRLELAEWVASAKNPLFARVAVNRWWAEIFGRGIVPTLDDFGAKGERPSHPELLDWLAVELQQSRWSMKHMIRLIVTSAAYRQSARVTDDELRLDPDNALLSRGPRFRMPAEMIRDNALAASGLLSDKMFGPPVFPIQPPNIWRVTGVVDNTYRTSSGEDRWRRGIYTILRRSAPYPSFMNFDATDRSMCVARRARTNTPLQALTLMNDPVYVEAARALADRIVAEAPDSSTKSRLEFGWRLCVAREPSARETQLLDGILRSELSHAQSKTAARRAAGATSAEKEAWFYVATVLLNLDETITKG